MRFLKEREKQYSITCLPFEAWGRHGHCARGGPWCETQGKGYLGVFGDESVGGTPDDIRRKPSGARRWVKVAKAEIQYNGDAPDSRGLIRQSNS